MRMLPASSCGGAGRICPPPVSRAALFHCSAVSAPPVRSVPSVHCDSSPSTGSLCLTVSLPHTSVPALWLRFGHDSVAQGPAVCTMSRAPRPLSPVRDSETAAAWRSVLRVSRRMGVPTAVSAISPHARHLNISSGIFPACFRTPVAAFALSAPLELSLATGKALVCARRLSFV